MTGGKLCLLFTSPRGNPERNYFEKSNIVETTEQPFNILTRYILWTCAPLIIRSSQQHGHKANNSLLNPMLS